MTLRPGLRSSGPPGARASARAHTVPAGSRRRPRRAARPAHRLVARSAATAITWSSTRGRCRCRAGWQARPPARGCSCWRAARGRRARRRPHRRRADRGRRPVQAWTREDEDLLACDVAWRALVPRTLRAAGRRFRRACSPLAAVTQVLLRRCGRRRATSVCSARSRSSRAWRCVSTCCFGILPRAGGRSSAEASGCRSH